jgi:6-phosphogluconate dehydrogenase (decarboxylating)
MARKYSKATSQKVAKALHERKKGTLKSGPGGKGGKVKSRKQAIAIGLSEARAEGKKVPKKKTAKKKKAAKKKS